FYSPLESVETFYEEGFLYPIDKIAPKDDPLFDTVKGYVKPILMKDGHLYAMPIFYKAHSMAYRKDLFRENGLPDRPPATWDELFNFALKIHNPEKGIVGYAIFGGSWLFSHVLWQAGGDYMTYGVVETATGKFTPLKEGEEPEKKQPKGKRLTIRSKFQDENGQKAVNFCRRLLFCKWAWDSSGGKMLFRDIDLEAGKFIWHEEIKSEADGRVYKLSADKMSVSDGAKTYKLYDGVAIAPAGKDIAQEVFQRFKRKMLGMMILSSGGGRDGVLPDYNPAVVGLGNMPIGPSGKLVTIANTGNWCVNSQIAPERREAAWRFIKFMCGKKVQKLKVKLMVERGQASYVLPEYLKMAGYEQFIPDVPKDWVAANKALEKCARAVPNKPGWRMAQQQVNEILEYLLTTENVDVAASLSKRAEYCDVLFAQAMGESKSQKLSGVVKVLIFAVILVVFVIMLFVIVRTTKNTLAEKLTEEDVAVSKKKGKIKLLPYFLMAPAVGVIFCFHYLPLMRGSVMAFYDYKIVGESIFVGIDNFVDAFLSSEFWWAMYVTLKYMVVSLSIGFCLPIIVALMLDEIPWGKYFFRTVYYLPAITSGLIIMLMWKEFYDPTPAGMLNKLFAYFGMGPYKFLKDPNVALVCVVIPGAWAAAGPGSILYLAALKCVPTDLYESASIDGARWYHKIFYITLPTLFPLILINFIGAFLGAMQGMGNILVMTGGGPDRQTQVIGLEIFFNAYVYLKFGYAITLAWILGALLLGVTAIKMQIMKKVDFTAAESN
ncbi:MAG: extracellular solute-binding protein, partial [Planctomycetota bacterium]